MTQAQRQIVKDGLAHRIARLHAISVVECNSNGVRDSDGNIWYDISSERDVRINCADEVRYLDIHGILIHKPGVDHLVRIKG